ncbi:S10 family peptidase [Sinomicrobium sp.]
MRHQLSLFLVSLSFYSILSAQKRTIPADTAVITTHELSVNGSRFSYTATTGMQPVWGKDDKAIATLYYTYYERKNVKDRASRPLVISFNGGPGSASVWMHIAYTGPRLLNIDEEGYPVMPYGIKENPYSILDIADIVYVNPVNTGYSRIIETKDQKPEKSDFFGVNADIKYLAEWLNTFVSRINRWRSPKYLIGESYGTTRVSGLALELQNQQWMYLNGVILVSPTELGIKRDGPVEIANRLPYFAAAAWYHRMLPPDLQQRELEEILPEVEEYSTSQLLPALAMGGQLDKVKKEAIAEKMARYSGLSKKVILQHNLDIPYRFYWKELLRDQGYTIGRLDSRYLGMDREDAGEAPDYNAELNSWLHSFTPAMNYYIKEQLNFSTDVKYNMFGPVHPWDRTKDRTGENLRQAMAQNPYLHLMVQSGYFDGACTYFNAKYTIRQMDPAGKLSSRMQFKTYKSGHMMYLRKEDLKTANEDIRNFIKKSLPEKGAPAQYKLQEGH